MDKSVYTEFSVHIGCFLNTFNNPGQHCISLVPGASQVASRKLGGWDEVRFLDQGSVKRNGRSHCI